MEPFAVPRWVRECTRPSFVDANTEAQIQALKRDGVQAVFNAGGFKGLVFYDGQVFHYAKEGGGEKVDVPQIRQNVARIQRAGMKVIGTMPPMWEIQVLDEHRDWQRLTAPAARPKDPHEGWPPALGCWTSPFGRWYIEKNVKMVKAFGWDAENIDGFGTYVLCYCPYCKAAYRKACGGEVPPKEDVTDSNYRRFVRWRLEGWGSFVQEWQMTLKELNPDFAFLPWSTGPGRWWHWTGLPNVEGSELGNLMLDAPVVELFWDWPPDQGSNLLPSFTTRFYRGFCQERPVWMHTYFRSQGQQNAVAPRVESEFRFMSTFGSGAVPVLAYWLADKTTAPAYYLDLIKQREKWFIDATSVKWAAMLVSENSRLFTGISGYRSEFGGAVIGSGVDSLDRSKLSPGERRFPAHLEAALGFYRAALEAHLPLDFISDYQVEKPGGLDSYRVLVLPDATCLSERALENIRRFTERGGGLVASQGSSLFDETGAARSNFGLADLFGAAFVKAEDHTATWPNYDRTVQLTFENHPITSDPAIEGNLARNRADLDFIGWTTLVKAETGTKTIVRWKGPEANAQSAPFLLLSEHGKGRVVYFAAAIDQSYFISPYQYERALLVHGLGWAANSLPPVELKGPMCALVNYYTQENGRRLVVHLVNELNSTANRAWPENNPSMREEVIPVRGLTLTIRQPTVSRAFLEPAHEALAVDGTSESKQVHIPELGLHALVVAE
jgi:hypothetical protein